MSCLCQKVEELGFREKLTSTFATSLRRDKVTIAGLVFTLSAESISIATRIPNNGETWLKCRDIDLENYKMYLKPSYKADPKCIFPFKCLLEMYAPLMKMIMKYFTREGRFSRLYQYHVRLLMHFTSVEALNLPHYLYRSMVKME